MSRSRARAEGEGVLGARAQLARVPRRVTLRWSGSAGGVDTLSALAGPASLTLLAPRHPALVGNTSQGSDDLLRN